MSTLHYEANKIIHYEGEYELLEEEEAAYHAATDKDKFLKGLTLEVAEEQDHSDSEWDRWNAWIEEG